MTISQYDVQASKGVLLFYFTNLRKVLLIVLVLVVVSVLAAYGGKVRVDDASETSRDKAQNEKNQQGRNSETGQRPQGNMSTGGDTSDQAREIDKIGQTDDIDEKSDHGVPSQPGERRNKSEDDEVRREISITDFAAKPDTIRIKPGTTIVWKNNDGVAHDIHSNDDAWHGESFVETYEMLFETTGTYYYHCHIHGRMNGTIIVEQDEL